jgi:hypothetical protein
MRRVQLLKELFSLPVIAIIVLMGFLGNLTALIAIFPPARSLVAALTSTAWLAPVIAWLALVSIPDWLVAVQLLLLVILFELTYRKLKPYYWHKPRIVLSAQVETTTMVTGVVTSATLLARSRAEHDITDCTATLETATNLSGARLIPVIKIRNNRLRWADDKPASDDCQITIPPGTTHRISVAHTLKNFQFTACKPSTSDSAVLGLYIVRIRVDGKLMGADIEPQVFDGYLYVQQAANDGSLTMLFGQGDWKKDKHLRNLRLQSEAKK